MKYMGSKRRIAKEIIPIMLKDRTEGQYFYDLFCGGGNICENIKENIVANDFNENVVKALELIKNNLELIPKNKNEFTEQMYKDIKKTNSILKSYIGFALSYGGKWFGGWCRDGKNKRDYVNESYKNAVIQNKKIQNVDFLNKSYDEVKLKENSIIYCDIPYKETTKYNVNSFDHEKFYNWCIEKHKEGHQVFISEYDMPSDRFESIWSKEITSSLTKDTGSKKGIEKLFIVKGDI